MGKYSLENASNEQVKTALSMLFSNPDSEALKNSLSSKKTIEPKIIENTYEHLPGPAQGIGPEDQPATTDDLIGQEYLQQRRHAVPVFAYEIVQPNHEGVVEAEEDKVPSGPMPKAEQKFSCE